MSCDCYISIQCPIHRIITAQVALDYMARFPHQHDPAHADFHQVEKHLWRFLQDLATGQVYIGAGSKGDVLMWGQVGNYVDIERFVEDLRLFCEIVYHLPDTLAGYNRVLVTFQQQDQDAAFYCVGTADGSSRGLPQNRQIVARPLRFEEDAFSFGTV